MIDTVKIYIHGSHPVSGDLDSDKTVEHGGYGIVININGKRVKEISGGRANTTNLRLELIAAIESLLQVSNKNSITIYLGNEYIMEAIKQGSVRRWAKTGFAKKKHADLWNKFNRILANHSYKIAFIPSREVRTIPDFLLAEKIARAMSCKKNSPIDIKTQAPAIIDLFGNYEVAQEGSEVTEESFILDSISVDASCLKNPGPMEYRGVHTGTKEVIFEKKYKKATNNIGEFLAIVHALEYVKKEGKEVDVIYSDSVTAITWVRHKSCKTAFPPTEDNKEVLDALKQAIGWLASNQYRTRVLKWNTEAWGQIAADYGRK